MRAGRHRPLLVWVLTSAVLLALASRTEHGLVVAGIYVGVNAIGVAIVVTKEPPYSGRAIAAVLWCAAAQSTR